MNALMLKAIVMPMLTDKNLQSITHGVLEKVREYQSKLGDNVRLRLAIEPSTDNSAIWAHVIREDTVTGEQSVHKSINLSELTANDIKPLFNV